MFGTAYDAEYFGGRSSRGSRARNAGLLTLIHRRYGGLTLLDIGHGTGDFLELARKLYDTSGFEVSPFAHAHAKQRLGPTVDLALGDGTTLPYPNESYDIVVALDVLEHVDDVDRTLSNVYRVLRSGGSFVMSVPNTCSLGRHLKGPSWFAYRDPTHVRLLAPQEWLDSLRRAQLLVVRYGSDCLWDPPYFAGPGLKSLERLVLGTGTFFKRRLWPISSNLRGENLLVIATKTI